MSGFNIQPSDLQGMIAQLTNYGSQLGAVSTNMKSYANRLNSTWKDPQYTAFITSVDGMAKNLKANQEQLIQMAKQLRVLKQNLERTRADYNRMKLR